MLQQALDRSIKGQGQFVTVIGEAGVGKSRLLHEFRRSVDREAVTLLEGRCQSYGVDTPYLPMLDALRRGLRINDLTSSENLHDTAVANIRAVSPDLEQYIPHLLHLLSIPSEQNKLPETLQGEALQRELEAALAAIITLNAARQPMVLPTPTAAGQPRQRRRGKASVSWWRPSSVPGCSRNQPHADLAPRCGSIAGRLGRGGA